MINEAVYCLMEGVGTAEAIDTVMKLGMNHPMGPLALADLIGLDTCLAILEVLHDGLGDPKYRPCPLLRKYVAAGWLGRKSKRGFYGTEQPGRRCDGVLRCLSSLPLTEEQREIQSRRARVRARTEIAPYAAAVGSRCATSSRARRKAWRARLPRMMIPEEYDGLGLDTLTYLVALEEIAAVDASVAVMISVHNSLPTQMILKWGSDEQKERFLKPMARGELLGAFALSEPEAGPTRRRCARKPCATATTGFSTARRPGSRAAARPT